jgi:lactate dehydrogenase-like 2-hydroxyacid dehydrogenase
MQSARARTFRAGLLPQPTCTRYRADPDVERNLRPSYLPLTKLLEWASIVSLHVPLTAETRHLMSVASLRGCDQARC